MRPTRGPALQIDLRKGKEAVRRRPLALTYPQLILGAIAFAVLMVALRQVSPAAALAVELGLSWLVGVCALTVFAMLWRIRDVVSVRYQLGALGLAVWFLAQAALVTYRALG